MHPQIREATPADLLHILAVYREARLAKRGSLSLEEATSIHAKMKRYPNYKVYVAEIKGQIVGTFELLIIDNLANGGRPSGLVEDVAVLPSFQGQGIGKEMMRFAMNRCKEHRCYKMALSSNETRTDAHRFYESLGFSRHGFSYRIEP
jgi:GNAT superfamily N-acetyltransferase